MRLSAGLNKPLCGWEWIEKHEVKKEGVEYDLSINNLDVDSIRLRVNRLCETERLKRRGQLNLIKER
jgi:hypothetical protein